MRFNDREREESKAVLCRFKEICRIGIGSSSASSGVNKERSRMGELVFDERISVSCSDSR